jgi:hypothetical protein
MTGGMPRWAFVPGEVLRPILPRSVSDRESPCQMICSEEPLATTGDHVAATRDDGARKGPAKIVEQRRRRSCSCRRHMDRHSTAAVHESLAPSTAVRVRWQLGCPRYRKRFVTAARPAFLAWPYENSFRLS